MKDKIVIEKFKIPEEAYDVITYILTEDERHFITGIDRKTFTASDAAKVFLKDITLARAEEFLQNGYKRGVFNLVDADKKIYSLNSFYGRLDVFAISEMDKYRALTEEQKNRLDSWYFGDYVASLDPDLSVRPTSDEVLPLKEVLEFIDKQDRTIYLNPCDCRALSGKCHKPVLTCITYKNGLNSFSHRGHSKVITKEEAKELVRNADKAGLMHTVNPNGICNCCGDCCYLFRAGDSRDSTGVWPKAQYIIETDPEKCISCGKCTKTCHFQVFTLEDGLKADKSRCVGCGICVGKCPKGALTLIQR
ncbi:MAG: 4Fe-4S ferredoxin, iron-sulfur binding domain protein [Eubacterium sp.]|jgi:Pyruvate/2-oxoacid:ferredoxin oxidoreductase delta subunit|nr:4Fe-4S ferredoxin, iron-sulfur binding domain protein [Eubacterium sp.]